MFKAQWEDWGKLKLEKRKKIVSFFWLNLSALIIKFFLQFILMMFNLNMNSSSQEVKNRKTTRNLFVLSVVHVLKTEGIIKLRKHQELQFVFGIPSWLK